MRYGPAQIFCVLALLRFLFETLCFLFSLVRLGLVLDYGTPFIKVAVAVLGVVTTTRLGPLLLSQGSFDTVGQLKGIHN